MAFVYVNCRSSDPKKHKDELADALKEFKRKVKKEGIMPDLRKHEYFVSPSKKRRIKASESLKQRKRDERKAEWQQKKSEN